MASLKKTPRQTTTPDSWSTISICAGAKELPSVVTILAEAPDEFRHLEGESFQSKGSTASSLETSHDDLADLPWTAIRFAGGAFLRIVEKGIVTRYAGANRRVVNAGRRCSCAVPVPGESDIF